MYNSFIGKFVVCIIGIGIAFIIGTIVFNLGVDSGIIKTKEAQATVLQIVPEMNCNKNGCSTTYNVTFKNDTYGGYLYSTYYTGWNLPAVGQTMTVKYTTFFPMRNVVVKTLGE